MLLASRRFLRPSDPPLFRCAIFFSPAQVYDPVAYLERGDVKILDSCASSESAIISIPVAIVYGEMDQRKEECRSLQGICDQSLLSVFVHEGGHEVPGLGTKSGVLDSVRVARQAITRAQLAV